jgi:ATP-dependent exoDNAse (exonuclease V) beta subunit
MKPCLTVYKASAGSGKTFTLAIQYIKLLIISDNPNAYSNILAVTFTNKATAEMKERIIEQLYGIWKALPSSDNYLQILQKELKDYGCEMNSDIIRERAGKALMCILHDYNRFRVETIDSFFQTILKNLAHELNLVANFKVDLNDKEVLNESVDRIIDRLHLTPDIMNLIMDYVNDRITNNQTWDISNEVKVF